MGKITEYYKGGEFFSNLKHQRTRYRPIGKLDLMQLYLNHVKTSYVLAYQSISPVDYATPNYLENYAIGFASPYKSPFHPDVCPPIHVYLGGRIGWIEKIAGACMSDAILMPLLVFSPTVFNHLLVKNSKKGKIKARKTFPRYRNYNFYE